MLVAIVLLGTVPYQELMVADPLAVGIDATGLRWLGLVIKAAALSGLFSTMLVTLLGQTRVFYTMSRADRSALQPAATGASVWRRLRPRLDTSGRTRRHDDIGMRRPRAFDPADQFCNWA